MPAEPCQVCNDLGAMGIRPGHPLRLRVEAMCDDLAAAQEKINSALGLTDSQLGCDEWCRGEHCLHVITMYRQALSR